MISLPQIRGGAVSTLGPGRGRLLQLPAGYTITNQPPIEHTKCVLTCFKDFKLELDSNKF